MGSDANKQLDAPAVCEVRSREGRFREWDEGKGYFPLVSKTIHEVFVNGEEEVVASTDSLQVAETVARLLSSVSLREVPEVLQAIFVPALTRHRALRRHEPVSAPDPNARHSIA